MCVQVCTGASGQVPMVTERCLTVCSRLHLCVCVCVHACPIIPVGCVISLQRGLHYHPGSLLGIDRCAAIDGYIIHNMKERGMDKIRQDKKLTGKETARQGGWVGQRREDRWMEEWKGEIKARICQQTREIYVKCL